MTNSDTETPAETPKEQPSAKTKIAQDRANRLEASLRANLLKRKAQSRARTSRKLDSDPALDC